MIRLGVVVLLLVACSMPAPNAPNPGPSHQAAELRVRLSLLFGENVLIIAKESEAAANHSDEYAGYLGLLSTNANDLRSVIGLAFGHTAADEFFAQWNLHNVSAVEYAIGMVIHNPERALQAKTNLGQSGAGLADFFTSQLHLNRGTLTEKFNLQSDALERFIDDASGQNYRVMYPELSTANAVAAGMGDILAPLIAKQFPDKFPGDAASHNVELRSIFNDLLQERAYLITMATDARINGRDTEWQGAADTLDANARAIGRYKDALAQEVGAAETYASDPSASAGLTQAFVSQLSTTAGLPWSVVAHQADATARVIDDQRAKSYKALAGDDRASATAMQPLADAIAASVKG
ncbi:MAG TPA: hypothetical protein VHQ03_05195 [Candidatus Dormibacteraeota bacterium]|nr:hypothetical protein [Candidatus Dormibacteraeota bacterium]